MSTVTDDTVAPGYDPGAVDLPWYRRALSQGAGYSAPSALFLLIPLYYTRDASPGMMALVVVSVLLIGFFFLGTSLVMHWAEWKRWMWILGLMGSILLLLPSIETTRPHYFVAYVTTTAAVLVRFRHATILIVAISVLGWPLDARRRPYRRGPGADGVRHRHVPRPRAREGSRHAAAEGG